MIDVTATARGEGMSDDLQMPRTRLVVIAAVCALSAWVGLTATPALASNTHVFVRAFGSSGAGDGQFAKPHDVAVDESRGDVYVADTGNARVEKFDGQGNFLVTFGADVGGPGVNICSSGCQAGTPGSGPGQFRSPTFVAVDNSGGPWAGDVYVADSGDNLVSKFDSSGSLIATWGSNGQLDGSTAVGGPFGSLAGIAVDTNGNLWVYAQSSEMFEFAQDATFIQDWNSERGVNPVGIAVDSATNLYVSNGNLNLTKFNSSGTQIGDIGADLTNTTGLAVDPSTNDLYADDGGSTIRHYASSCDPSTTLCSATDSFGTGQLSSATGLAVDPTSNTVYAADTGDGRVDVFGPPPPAAPSIDSTSATTIGETTADLNAQINPNQRETTYHFEYGTADCSANPCTSTPESSSIGSDRADHSALAQITGLQANTEYHYRVVAHNELGTTNGPDRTFTTFPPGGSFTLPDTRAYEMVSPPNKNEGEIDGGNSIFGAPVPVQSSADGNAVTFASQAAFSDAQGSLLTNQYLATRTGSGWTTQPVMPAQNLPGGSLDLSSGALDYSLYQGFTPDLAHAFLTANDPQPVPGAPADYFNPYLRDNTNGTYRLLSTLTPPIQPAGQADSFTGFVSDYAGSSADASHVIFSANDALTPEAVPGQTNLYEWAAGQLRLVSILPDGTADHNTNGQLQFGAPGTHVTNFGRVIAQNATNDISADGSRIFWTGSDGQLYLRENGLSTVRVSASQKTNGSGPGGTDPNGPQPVTFEGANTDGSTALFASTEELTNDANTGSADQGANLYRFDSNTGNLTDLTVDNSGSDPSGAGVEGVLGLSDDGSYVYFVADGGLAAGASAAQQPNLYVSHNGTTAFIATLNNADSSNWNNRNESRTARVSPNGQYIAFESTESLTGYDNIDVNTGIPDLEVYEYSSNSNTLACASCNPTGQRPTGDSFTPSSPQTARFSHARAFAGGWQTPTDQQRYLSDSGRLFFDSSDALVARDTNGKDDVYEYEDRHLYLISLGRGTEGSEFLDASASGNDVFFVTRDSLVPQDRDGGLDVYDARVGGGFPTPNMPAPCNGEDCKPAPAPAPAMPTAASISFIGPGNTSPGHPTAKVELLRKSVRGSRFMLTVRVPDTGRITISGVGIKTVRRTVATGGTYRLTVSMTSKERRTLKHRHRLTLRLRLGYTPASGTPSSATVTVTVTA